MRNRVNSSLPIDEVNVGWRLRVLRTERGLSIRALAELSGLNVNTLSLIENGKTSPSVSTLQQVASALKEPITAFFETQALPKSVIFQKAEDRSLIAFAHGMLADMGAGFTSPGLEPFEIVLKPHSDSGEKPIVHTGLEFVYCLEGKIGYRVEDVEYILEPGDSLLFEARLPHRWFNLGGAPSRSLLLLCPTDERDHPDERHFTSP